MQELNNRCTMAVFGSEMSRARAFEGEVEILLVQIDAESRIEIPFEHALTVHFENPCPPNRD